MLQRHWTLCAFLLCFSAPANSTRTSPPLEVRLLRVEGAASGVRKSAERLSEIAEKINRTSGGEFWTKIMKDGKKKYENF